MLNDDRSAMDCKRCLMVEHKRYGDISFSGLGHIDLQHYTICNLRCTYCAYTRDDMHYPPQYDALALLRLFSPDDVHWNAHVDFAGGEPTLLENLEEYLSFFRSRRIRVLMFTNAVRFHQAIYDGLADGSIYWVTTSLDAGTPSTYKALRGRDQYEQVLENLSRYAVAGSKGKGMLSVKYIFCGTNCGEDDLLGFAYAMLALRPQKVWLTFDFAPMYLHQWDYDYSKQIEAYARVYLLLKKHGIEAFHYYKEAIATVSREGAHIMKQILAAIERQSPAASLGIPDLIFKDFRANQPLVVSEPSRFSVDPLRVGKTMEFSKEWSLEGKRVLLAPACPLTQKLLSDPELQRAAWIGFVDRNPILQGKEIEGRVIFSYESISSLKAHAILVVPPEKHRLDILDAIARNAPGDVLVAELS
jgi:wyosine [tRNA(Phe)-imidazoG37] synthetase (radical SAM superfamily)